MKKDLVFFNEILSNSLLKNKDDLLQFLEKKFNNEKNIIYSQLESFLWLQRKLSKNTQLPPLRGWAASPDLLYQLHTHILNSFPQVIVEFGSGASTLVIADALMQNGSGKLISFDHEEYYASITNSNLKKSFLDKWVDIKFSKLEEWKGDHPNYSTSNVPPRWYSINDLKDICNIDLVFVDGPPGSICLFSRYPALPALINHLSPDAQIWMDDTIRDEERNICECWAKKFNLELNFLPMEKGLGILKNNKNKLIFDFFENNLIQG